ncbi:hypothetical protein GNX18_09435 [Microbulbifer sp. SH-1]|uniref:hypothetical protein n=1 Tax=Microbulbifer sp. SH-1 TaxID=2681547 RepID=UPI001408B7BF|nr:hypothetical protein [Microbulbifer sp. SH-1]QIL89952.1 hypothetical protein GNX18_09435 [Microbulbifer sp. SH-1]
MKLSKLLFTAFLLSALAGCASGTSENQSAGTLKTEPAASLAKDNEEKICKVRAITGSRFKQKTCMTEKEWENMAYETKKMLDEDTRSKPTNY